MSVRYSYVIAVTATLGCATASSTPGASRSQNLITEQEIAAITATNAFEAVEKLRPNFLHSRGANASGSDSGLPDVYLGAVRYGDVSSLRNIAASEVREIRFYKGAEAATKYGMQNPNGVNGIIEVTLKH
jgi:hypothetical protein